jgi:DNA-binding protein HU-beta
MTKQELVTELAKRAGLSRAKALEAIDTLFGAKGIVPAELNKGGKVQIPGFGQFETKTRAARNGRDPRTGRSIAIARSTAPVFRPGQPLRDLLKKKR